MCVPLTMDNARIVPMTDYPAARALAAQMSTAWIAFARDGDPNHADLPVLARRACRHDLRRPARVEHDPYAAERLVCA